MPSLTQLLRAPIVPREFYDRDPSEVAPDLLGKLLIHKTEAGTCIGRIVETEAYLSANDSACHAARGQTLRNASMFARPGTAYVYMIHSRWCFNTVTEPESCGSAVLIRALEPLVGLDLMRERRGREKLLDLARGPARLCEALAIDRTQDGLDLTRRGSLWLADDGFVPTHATIDAPRIGISQAADLLLRFHYMGNPFVSKPHAKALRREE